MLDDFDVPAEHARERRERPRFGPRAEQQQARRRRQRDARRVRRSSARPAPRGRCSPKRWTCEPTRASPQPSVSSAVANTSLSQALRWHASASAARSGDSSGGIGISSTFISPLQPTPEPNSRSSSPLVSKRAISAVPPASTLRALVLRDRFRGSRRTARRRARRSRRAGSARRACDRSSRRVSTTTPATQRNAGRGELVRGVGDRAQTAGRVRAAANRRTARQD